MLKMTFPRARVFLSQGLKIHVRLTVRSRGPLGVLGLGDHLAGPSVFDKANPFGEKGRNIVDKSNINTGLDPATSSRALYRLS